MPGIALRMNIIMIIGSLATHYKTTPQACPGLGNVGEFTSNLSIQQTDNSGVERLAGDFGAKLHFTSSYRYYKLIRTTDSQYDIGGVLAGSLGTPPSLSGRPQVTWFLV